MGYDAFLVCFCGFCLIFVVMFVAERERERSIINGGLLELKVKDYSKMLKLV